MAKKFDLEASKRQMKQMKQFTWENNSQLNEIDFFLKKYLMKKCKKWPRFRAFRSLTFLGCGGVRRHAKSPNFALISTLLWFLFLFTAHLPSRQAKQQQTNRQLRKL